MDENSFMRAISDFRAKLQILLFDKIDNKLMDITKEQAVHYKLNYYNEDVQMFAMPQELDNALSEEIKTEIIILWRDTLQKY